MRGETIRGRAVVELPVSPEMAFAYVARYQNAPLFIPCLRRLHPINGRTYGLGAQFRAELAFAGVSADLEFVVTAFEPGRRMAAVLPRQDGARRGGSSWEFAAVANQRCRATFACWYEVPCILPGIAGRAILTLAREALRHSLAEGMWRLEQALAASAPPPAERGASLPPLAEAPAVALLSRPPRRR